jgi:hypothetical protein
VWDENPFRQLENYLLNLRQLTGLLTNIFLNQVSVLVNQVKYDKELFNYEEYKARALQTHKNLTRLVFMTNAKLLVQDYYKKRAASTEGEEKLIHTPRKIHSFLSHFALHLPTLRKIEAVPFLHIEPLLLVFFAEYNFQVIPKEAFS